MDRAAFAQFAKLEQVHWWFRGRRALYVPLLEHVLQRALGRPPRDLLVGDVGCGVGGFLQPMQRFGRVFGMELDLPAIEYCRQRGHEATLVARCDALPLRPGQADLLTLWDVLEHTPDDRAVLAQLHDALRPGGFVALSLPAYQFLFTNNDRVAQHYRRYTRGGITARLAETGFEVVKATYVNTLLSPAIVPAVLALKLKQALLPVPDDATTNLSFAPPRPINELLFRCFAGELSLLRRLSTPFGHSLFVVARRPTEGDRG